MLRVAPAKPITHQMATVKLSGNTTNSVRKSGLMRPNPIGDMQISEERFTNNTVTYYISTLNFKGIKF
jgi:hypothetical protein